MVGSNRNNRATSRYQCDFLGDEVHSQFGDHHKETDSTSSNERMRQNNPIWIVLLEGLALSIFTLMSLDVLMLFALSWVFPVSVQR
jgi:hypothetical protein